MTVETSRIISASARCYIVGVLALLVAVLAASCTSADPAAPVPSQAPTSNIAATVEAQVSATLAAVPTATPQPAATQIPTSVPVVTAVATPTAAPNPATVPAPTPTAAPEPTSAPVPTGTPALAPAPEPTPLPAPAPTATPGPTQAPAPTADHTPTPLPTPRLPLEGLWDHWDDYGEPFARLRAVSWWDPTLPAPELYLRRQRDDEGYCRVEVFVHWGVSLSNPPFMTVALDNRYPASTNWDGSESEEAAFYPGDSWANKEFIRFMMRHSTLALTTTQWHSSLPHISATFELAGIGVVGPRIMAGC